MANGIQALMICPAVCRRTPGAADVAAGSCSSLQIRFGFQNRRKSTVARREMTPPAISTRFESTWLDQKYCVRLNETPTTRMAGSTSKVSLQPTIARTSQNGTMIPVMGRMRPIIALRSDSGRPDTAASVCTGVPMAPHATGDVLASRLSAAAWNGLNPSPIMKAPAIATDIQKTVTATTTAVPAPAMAHQCGLTLSPANRPNSTRIGNAATRVERIQLCNGSYVWVQAMGHPWGVVRRLLHRESDRVDDEWLQGNVLPIRDDRDHPVGTGPQRVQHEVDLAPAEVDDPGHATGNRIVRRRHVAIHEQVVVSRCRSLIGRRNDLHAGRLERDLHRAGDASPVAWRRDLHCRSGRLRQRGAGQERRGAECRRQPRCPGSHCGSASRGDRQVVVVTRPVNRPRTRRAL